MKERPILYTGAMVRSILEDRKTMTRRVVKSFKHLVPALGVEMDCIKDVDGWPSRLDIAPRNWECCPYGQPGDRLWVREAFSGPWEWRTIPPAGWGWDTGQRPPIWYWADGNPPEGDWTRPKPSIHMPRWASRILLEITSVRVERVQDISEEDASAEGVSMSWAAAQMRAGTWRQGFAQLWDSINAKRGFGWDANPWTWVIEFKRVEGK